MDVMLYLIIACLLLLIIVLYLTKDIKGCGGNCKQGRLPCDCGKVDNL